MKGHLKMMGRSYLIMDYTVVDFTLLTVKTFLCPLINLVLCSYCRDSDRCLENNVVVRNNPSPASGSLAPSVGSNMNGNSYSFSAMSPEFLSDMASLDFLPTSSWDLGGGEEQNIGDSANLPTSLGGPSTPASAGSINSGAQQRTQHPSGSAFSPELLSGRGSPSTRSPAQLSATGSPAPGRVTPFQNTFPFSPVSSQTVSRTSSPAPNLIKREDTSLPSGNVELSNLSPISGLIGDCQNSTNNTTQKLRNLLTHGIEEADSSVPKTSNDKIDENENGFSSRNNSDMVCSRNENIILRELLNQEDEEMRDESAKTLPCDSNCNVNLSSELCSNDSGQKRTVNNNNMLRKVRIIFIYLDFLGSVYQECRKCLGPKNFPRTHLSQTYISQKLTRYITLHLTTYCTKYKF